MSRSRVALRIVAVVLVAVLIYIAMIAFQLAMNYVHILSLRVYEFNSTFLPRTVWHGHTFPVLNRIISLVVTMYVLGLVFIVLWPWWKRLGRAYITELKSQLYRLWW